MSGVRVRVPASSANLGPGFDVLAAALGLWVECELTETGRFAVDTDLQIARDRRNLMVRAFARRGGDPDRFRFTIRSEVPLSGGLGTSAAAYLCGLLAADALAGGDGDVLADAIALEGHPDNVAAALLGGVVMVADGVPTRIAPPAGLSGVLVVPAQAVRTREARAALPDRVPMADAVFNAAHTALLALALERGDLELLARALTDRLHQPYRASLYPRSAALVQDAAALGALGATVSGAGPTVLLWVRAEDRSAVADRARAQAAGWAAVHPVDFVADGAVVQFTS